MIMIMSMIFEYFSVFLDSCGLFSCCTQTPTTGGAILSASEPAVLLLLLLLLIHTHTHTHTHTHSQRLSAGQGFFDSVTSLHGARLNSFCAVLSGCLRSERGLLEFVLLQLDEGAELQTAVQR